MTHPDVRREQPGPGQESVWAYPRPPRVELTAERVIVELAGETVGPQEGGFYGGWITDRVVGPFKGPDGTSGW